MLPASVRPRGGRPIPEGQDPKGGGRQVLVVRGRKAADLPSPVYGVQGLVPSDYKAMEGHREGPQVEVSKGPLG